MQGTSLIASSYNSLVRCLQKLTLQNRQGWETGANAADDDDDVEGAGSDAAGMGWGWDEPSLYLKTEWI